MHRILLLTLLLILSTSLAAQNVIRINQLGYLPSATKVAVLLSKSGDVHPRKFELRDAMTGEVVWSSTSLRHYGAYGTFAASYRLDFSGFQKEGGYFLSAAGIRSPEFRIGRDVYSGAADFLLKYMRQQRCGFNPFLRDSCHTRDGYIIYHPTRDSSFIDVVGGWHDASDYLQYVTTSATATYQMLFAYTRHPEVFGDQYNSAGLPGSNGIPDILDEAKWGLDWLAKMYPEPDLMFNQIADDRDHLGFRLPTQDPVSYGRGKERPVYTATGRPQGIMQYKNRSTGLASTAGKFASAFALGAGVMRKFYPHFADSIRDKAIEAYELGAAHPGVCQTAPCRAPYFYEEDNWHDDMQLAAAQLSGTISRSRYLSDAVLYGSQEGSSRWMGTDSARHYQWYPFVNLGHQLLARDTDKDIASGFIGLIREGLKKLHARGAGNAFLFGTPFNWCSNNYVSAALTDIRLYERATGDTTFREMEAALRDWLFGCNPWGTSMIVGLPHSGISPKDPHSAFTHLHGYAIDGGLVDGPVRTSIFKNLKGIHLSKPDAFADFQTDIAVYHDDWGDYSTNEPTMDGTASLSYYFASLEAEGNQRAGMLERSNGAIVRKNRGEKAIYLAFTGHEFADGGEAIRKALKRHGVKASFFFTGDFLRNTGFAPLVRGLRMDGHYIGGHSDKHLLYASWEKRDSLLVTRDSFISDIQANYKALQAAGIKRTQARFFLPPYEWHNRAIGEWCSQLGLTLVNFTPGTYSNADYTTPDMKNYLPSDSIYARILRYEGTEKDALNGFILLMHIGTSPLRTDKFYTRLDPLITELKRRGYTFKRFE